MRILILATFLLLSDFSFAASNKKRRRVVKKKASTNFKKKTPRKNRAVIFVDETQRFISNFWHDVNYGMDSFFAGEKYARDLNKANILAYYDIFKREGEPLKNYFDIKIKIHLPKLSKRLSLTIEKERDDILESRSNQVTQGQATKDSDYAASVNYTNLSDFINTELNTGFRFSMPLDTFIKYRLYQNFDPGWFKIHIEQRFIYFRQEYLSEYTQLSFGKQISENFSLSQSNTVSWSDADDIFVLRNGLLLSQKISDKKSMSYSIGANALFDPTFYYNKYDASISYRQILYKTWLFGSLGFGADFLKENNWEMKNFGVIRLEMIFQ